MGTATRSPLYAHPPPPCTASRGRDRRSLPARPGQPGSDRRSHPHRPGGRRGRRRERSARHRVRARLQRALPAHTHRSPGRDAHGHAGAGAAARGLGRGLQRGRHHLHRRDERGSGGDRTLPANASRTAARTARQRKPDGHRLRRRQRVRCGHRLPDGLRRAARARLVGHAVGDAGGRLSLRGLAGGVHRHGRMCRDRGRADAGPGRVRPAAPEAAVLRRPRRRGRRRRA